MSSARHSQHYLDAVLANILDGIVTMDDKGVVLSFNPAAKRIFGYESAEVVGNSVSMLMPEPDRSDHDDHVSNYLRTGESKIIGINREVVGLRKNGTTFPMDLAVSRIQQDGVTTFIGSIHDISRHKEVQERLRNSEQRFELAVRGSKDGLWDWNIETDEVYYAPQYRALLGYEEHEFPGVAESFRTHLHPDDRDRVLSAFSNHLKHRIPFDEEFRHRARDGGMRSLHARGQAIWNEAGWATRMAGSVTDITDRKKAEKTLERQTLSARLMYQATAMAAETESFREALQWCVDIVCKMTGWPVGHIYLPDEENPGRLVPSRIWRRGMSGAFGPLRDVTERTSFAPGVGLPGRIWATGKPAWIANVQKDDNFPRAQLCHDIGVKGAFGFPIKIKGEIVAILEFFTDGEMQADEDLLMRLRTVGEQVGRVLERKRADADVRKARDALAAANRAKSQFLANMSHELRTPLNSVIGFSNVLLKNKSGTMDERQLSHLERIRDNGIHLLALINGVLDISRIEAGRVQMEIESIAVDGIVRGALSTIEGSVLEKEITLSADLPDDLEPIEVDGTRLKQVLINLLGNAVKFTEDGEIVVRLIPARGTRRPERIEVEDTGIGIDRDKLSSIFDAFQQADSSTTRKYGGTGLGLAISRSLCRLMGFDLIVVSELDRGSTFTVLLEPNDSRESRVVAGERVLGR